MDLETEEQPHSSGSSSWWQTWKGSVQLIGTVLFIGGLIIGGIFLWGAWAGRDTTEQDLKQGKEAGEILTGGIQTASQLGWGKIAEEADLQALAGRMIQNNPKLGFVRVLKSGQTPEAGGLYLDERASNPKSLQLRVLIAGRSELVIGAVVPAERAPRAEE